MFIMIGNEGVCDIESFTLLGASSARGTDAIGQFGSGAKHAINLCLREGVPVVVFIGTERYEFTMRPRIVNGKTFNQVYCNDTPKDWVVEFGALDWTGMELALREFISNAIDQVGWSKMVVTTETEAVGVEGQTRVYVGAHPDALKMFGRLDTYFLHASGRDKETFLPGISDVLRVYRRGVLVFEQKVGVCLGAYNFKDIKVSECRVAKASDVSWEVGRLLLDDMEFFQTVLKEYRRDLWEACDAWFLSGSEEEQLASFYKVFGEDAVLLQGDATHAAASGKKIIDIGSSIGFHLASRVKVPVSSAFVPKYKELTQTVSAPSPKLMKKVKYLWRMIVRYKMHHGKACPLVWSYTRSMKGGALVRGFYDNGAIFIESDSEDLQTILEELAHHASGAADGTRDFQEWILKFTCKMMKEKIDGLSAKSL